MPNNQLSKVPRRLPESKKGLALPIDTMVALAIAIVVLLALVAFFMGGVKSNTAAQTSQQRFQSCCQGYVLGGCGDVPETHDCGVDEKGNNVNLAQLASAIQIYGDSSVRTACQCVGSITTTTIPFSTTTAKAAVGTWRSGKCNADEVSKEPTDCAGNPPSASLGEPLCCVKK